MHQSISKEKNLFAQNGKSNFDISMGFFLIFFVLLMRGLESEMYLTFAFMLMWAYIAFLTDIGSFSNALKNKNMIFVYIYLIYVFIISFILEGIVTSIGFILSQLSIFVGIFMFNYYKSKYSIKGFKRLLGIVLIIWVYYCIKALIFYSRNPNAARQIISGNGDEFGAITIGEGYGLAFGCAILGVYLFSLIKVTQFKNNKGVNIIAVLVTVICFFISLKTGSTITLLAMIAGLIFSVYFNIGLKRSKPNKNSSIRIIISNISILSLLLLLAVNLKTLGQWLISLSSLFSSDLLASRIEQIGIKLLTGSSEGTLGARELLYNKSINTFLDNPLFGTSIEYGLRMNPLLGGHSELFDNIARLGLIGIVPFLLIFFVFIKNERKSYNNYTSGAYIITLLIMFILNPFNFPQAHFVLFFIIPSIGLLVSKSVNECRGNNDYKISPFTEVLKGRQ